MTPSQLDVLNLITHSRSGLAIWSLAAETGRPAPSIRRVIGELRKMGWKIEHRKVNGFFYPRYILAK